MGMCVQAMLTCRGVPPQNIMAQATAWAGSGRWAELAAEKAAALSQMARTLETYSRLLETPAPPADGAARLLQQVMR